MKVLFICKASIENGLGHLIRSRTLASIFHKKLFHDGLVKLIAIGPEKILKPLLLDEAYSVEVLSEETKLSNNNDYWDFIFFDMLKISNLQFDNLKQKTQFTASISPIFNMNNKVDYFFHRTKYYENKDILLPNKSYLGLEYAIIQENCKKISAGRFEDNLNSESFPIAISMGGGDAANKTLMFLKAFRSCNVPAIIWVMLGEGYKHSYDQLINETKQNNKHEIILAKTNKSMWQIMQNCIMGIFPGGITTYESVYSGLPSINFYDSEKQIFLIQELLEKKASILGGDFTAYSFYNVKKRIEELYENKSELMQMHIKSKSLIDGNGGQRIFEICFKSAR